MTGPLAEGDIVKVDGRARDGVFLVESMEVLAWGDAAKTQRRAAAPRRVRVHGFVTDPVAHAFSGREESVS